VDPVVVDPPLDLRFVRKADRAGVYPIGLPTMLEPTAGEAIAEAPGVPRRVSDHRPDDRGILVRQCAFRHLLNRVVDGGGLIADYKDTLALIVQSGKGLSVTFRPRNHVEAPCALVLRVHRE